MLYEPLWYPLVWLPDVFHLSQERVARRQLIVSGGKRPEYITLLNYNIVGYAFSSRSSNKLVSDIVVNWITKGRKSNGDNALRFGSLKRELWQKQSSVISFSSPVISFSSPDSRAGTNYCEAEHRVIAGVLLFVCTCLRKQALLGSDWLEPWLNDYTSHLDPFVAPVASSVYRQAMISYVHYLSDTLVHLRWLRICVINKFWFNCLV